MTEINRANEANGANETKSVKKDSLDNVNDVFKLPIYYNKDVKKLTPSVVTDLELYKSIETDNSSIYEHVFQPSNKPSTKVLEQFSNYYTTDTAFLKNTQELIQTLHSSELNTINNKYNFDNFELNNVVSAWEEIKAETGFREKYLYIDWEFAKEFNNNPAFLQLMSCYNIASPLLSLCLPILVLIIPFIVLKIKGVELSIQKYIEILKLIASNHAIFKMVTQFNQVDNTQKIYLAVSTAFYLFSIYQNILVCVRFYSNMQKIHNYLFKFKKYVAYTIDIMEYHVSKSRELNNYNDFNSEVLKHKGVLEFLYGKLTKISPFRLSFSKISEIGHIMHTFYQIYDNEQYTKTLLYSFGFHGYFTMICQINTHVQDDKMTKATFVKSDNDKKGKPIFKQMYYPKFINEKASETDVKIIKNDCNLNKNMIITGPNASGKTTTLKTALINIILSQQIGFGCFDSLKFSPYDHIHCYLNIPDTSARDSLFQAEARRCKEIIDCIDEDVDKSHICIFDELYSGTNPEEAISSASAFLKYIIKNDNVTCLLTTHYIKICKKLAKNKKIKNYNMKSEKKNDNFEYTYLLQEGISNIKGGLKVLKDMNYPKEILDNTQ